jgi:UPF0716 family protein affecting phage T7 exclusion
MVMLMLVCAIGVSLALGVLAASVGTRSLRRRSGCKPLRRVSRSKASPRAAAAGVIAGVFPSLPGGVCRRGESVVYGFLFQRVCGALPARND